MGKAERLVVGIGGPSGAIYGIRLLEVLRAPRHRNSAKQTIALETDHTVEYVCGQP